MAKRTSLRAARTATPAAPVSLLSQAAASVKLPAPDLSSHHSLEACLLTRRSTREFSAEALDLGQLTQLLWAAQGVTGLGGLRTSPSAGALYPLRTYVAAGNVEGLEAGVYRYDPDGHLLKPVGSGDRRGRLELAAMGQECARQAAVAVLLTGHYGLSRREFGDECVRLAQLEAGHAAQNLCLQATALHLGVIGLGKFDKDLLREAMDIPEKEDPLYLLVAGRRRTL